MKVENMTSSKGNKVANQFVMTSQPGDLVHDTGTGGKWFQSYLSIIAYVPNNPDHKIRLDIEHWDYSKTTGKYRNQFLGETKAETQKKIDSGEYILTNLN